MDRPISRPAAWLRPSHLALAATLTVGLALIACNDNPPAAPRTGGLSDDRVGADPGTHRQYGTPVQLGNGRARTYVVLDKGVPREVGVALDERAMDGLPAPMAHDGGAGGGHGNMHAFNLALPTGHGTPYRFVELDWNAAGHEPAGVYDKPHFDFHFYTISETERNAIDPANPLYAQQAANFPGAAFVAPFYLDPATLAGGAPPAAVAVPRMGMHWLDVRSPELQILAGNPQAYRPFTATFIYGSWDGRFIFDEPMITRAHIMAKRDATDPAERDQYVPVSIAARYNPAGYYPSAYRITWDAQAKEYRIALTGLAWRD
jgi:hypothetical protein